MVRCIAKKSLDMDELVIDCPYCGESIIVLIDYSAGEQTYYEDCSVCCCPILFDLCIDQINKINVVVKTNDE